MNSKNNHVFHSINTSKLGLNYKHSFDNSKSLGRKLRKAFLSKNSMQFIQPKILETSFINNKFNGIFLPASNVKSDISIRSEINQRSTHISRKNISYFNNNHNSMNLSKLGESYITPKKLTTSIMKFKSQEKSFAHHKFLTITYFKKKNSQSLINNSEEKKIYNLNYFTKENKMDKLIENNLLKKIKFQFNKKLDFKIKNIDEKNKNKNIIEKIKKSNHNLLKVMVKTKKFEYKNNRKHQNLLSIRLISNKRKCELCKKLIDNFLYKLHYLSHPSQILNWIYLGNSKNANNNEDLSNFRISYVLNCAKEVHDRNLPKFIKYCHLQLEDKQDTDIISFFEQAFNFIESAKKNGKKILIHCKLGISRSPSILIAYLIKYMNFTALSALDFVKTKRKQIQPNPGFLCQLCSFERLISKSRKESINRSISKSTDFSSFRNTKLLQK